MKNDTDVRASLTIDLDGDGEDALSMRLSLKSYFE